MCILLYEYIFFSKTRIGIYILFYNIFYFIYVVEYYSKRWFKNFMQGFPDGAVVKNPPANAGDTGSSPGLGRSHMPRSNY